MYLQPEFVYEFFGNIEFSSKTKSIHQLENPNLNQRWTKIWSRNS